MTSRAGIAEAMDHILAELLRQTGASRTTLRYDWPELDFSVQDVVAEALAPGSKSMRGVTSINQRGAATAQWLERERRMLVQEDLRDADPAAPEALVTVYEAKAQMLAPIIREGNLQGWVSIHYAGGPRLWSDADKAALDGAVQAVHAVIQAAG